MSDSKENEPMTTAGEHSLFNSELPADADESVRYDLDHVRAYFQNDAYATEVTGIEITEVGERYAKVELDLDDRHRNAMGAVMGGVYFTMSDFAFAIASNIGGEPTVTLGSHITYLSPAKGNHLIAKAKCRKDGRRTCCYEILIRDELGTEVATVINEGYKVTK